MAKKEKSTTPRPRNLPGMEDRAIQALEDKAHDYADIRDERIRLSAKEGELKKDLLDLMKANKIEHYERAGVVIDIVHESENVKVKIKPAVGEELSHESDVTTVQ